MHILKNSLRLSILKIGKRRWQQPSPDQVDGNCPEKTQEVFGLGKKTLKKEEFGLAAALLTRNICAGAFVGLLHPYGLESGVFEGKNKKK